ncbi:unnamed protein product [Eruca vesicaria subsp. sativa]|uniref:Uncharacterized protein n=1 Tax=Eruca vesicaria subsp. sativa TaxID=29727 RepID=A0ABC8J322_ERUVS|nr:unnamed protein product [Eruca vesicaria subsp. sativa]
MEEASAEGNAQLEIVERVLKVYSTYPLKTKTSWNSASVVDTFIKWREDTTRE